MAKIVSVPWFLITFWVEAESTEAFDAEFDEGKIASARGAKTRAGYAPEARRPA